MVPLNSTTDHSALTWLSQRSWVGVGKARIPTRCVGPIPHLESIDLIAWFLQSSSFSHLDMCVCLLCFSKLTRWIETKCYVACFLGALQLVAKNKNVQLSDDVKVKTAVSFGMITSTPHVHTSHIWFQVMRKAAGWRLAWNWPQLASMLP